MSYNPPSGSKTTLNKNMKTSAVCPGVLAKVVDENKEHGDSIPGIGDHLFVEHPRNNVLRHQLLKHEVPEINEEMDPCRMSHLPTFSMFNVKGTNPSSTIPYPS